MENRTTLVRPYTYPASIGLFFLRLIPFAMLIVFHGWSKIVEAYGYFVSGNEWAMVAGVEKLGLPYPQYLALCSALAESLFAALLIFGLLTRFSAAIVVINFLVAVYRHVTSDMRFEMAALYLSAALALMFLGAGLISMDARIKSRRRKVLVPERPVDVNVYDPVVPRDPTVEPSTLEETTGKN